MLDFSTLADQCNIAINLDVIANIIKVESAYNPYAIGVVNGILERQPRNIDEAIATAKNLESLGWNFSIGLGQINYSNLEKYNLSIESAFDPCSNLQATIAIYNDCLHRASAIYDPSHAQLAAYSCYYSGNFTRGFVKENNKTSYVERVNNASINSKPIPLKVRVGGHTKSSNDNLAHVRAIQKNAHVTKRSSIREIRGD